VDIAPSFGKANPLSKSHSAFLILFLCFPTLARAQTVAPEGPVAQSQEAPASNAAGGRIKLDVVVTDKSGKSLSGLDLKDFTLLDNNLPGKILSFHEIDGTAQKVNPPVEVILVIDTVNVGIVSVNTMQEEVDKFLRQNGGHLAQPVSIFVFTNTGGKFLPGPFTDGNALAAQLDKAGSPLRTIGRAAGVNGAIERFQLSIQMLAAIVKSQAKRPGRKLLIWAGPGWPMLNGINIANTSKGQQQFFDWIVELSTGLREARISLYSVSGGEAGASTFRYEDFLKGVKSVEKANPPNLDLKVLAIQSGGRVLGPNNDVAAQIDSCVEDANAFYTLSFDPTHADRANQYQELKVMVGKPGLTAHTNTGYYNQP
jgi:VWFA-related protein